MFPNVRLMIAAVAASVVALSCGFGLFAAFRVNHEPLARLQSAPLQLVVGNAAPQSLLLAAIAPAEHAELGRASTVAVPPSVVPAAAAAQPAEQSATAVATAVQSTEQSATAAVTPAAEPTEQSTTAAATPAAEDQPAAARAAEAETPPGSAEAEPTSAPDLHGAASQDSSSQGAPSQDASSQDAPRQQQPSQAGDPATPDRAAEAGAGPAPAAAPSTAAIEPSLDQAPPVEQLARESEASPALAPNDAARATHVARRLVAHKAKRWRTTRRRRAHPGAFAAASAQSFAYAQPQFQTVPQSYQSYQSYPAPAPRQRLVRVKGPGRKTAKSHSAVGGPFVGAQTSEAPPQH
jgi:hypothetical protein